jgi:hypothetical protein
VGAPFRGSWWSHPRAHEIYDQLQELHRGAGTLFVKLVGGKVTYVHARLWPALLGAVGGRGAWQRDGLSGDARAVLSDVQRRGAVRSDQLAVPPAVARTAAIGELEARLLVQSNDVHTETGAHRKLLRTWSRWRADNGYARPALPAARALAELVHAADELGRHVDGAVPLPWTPSRTRRAGGDSRTSRSARS